MEKIPEGAARFLFGSPKRPKGGRALTAQKITPRRRRVQWRPLTKIIAYLLAAAVLITWFRTVTTGPNAALFALTIPAIAWIASEMRRYG